MQVHARGSTPRDVARGCAGPGRGAPRATRGEGAALGGVLRTLAWRHITQTPPGVRRRRGGSPVCSAAGSGGEDGAEALYASLFEGLDYGTVFATAEADSAAVGDSLPEGEWFYGEFAYPSFSAMVAEVAAPGSVFVDLGSGAGKALFAAALGCPSLAECRGVEILPTLAGFAETARARYAAMDPPGGGRLPPVTLRCENMFYSDVWAGADVVYCFATVLGPASQALLQSRLEDLPPGARALIVSKRMTSPLLRERKVFFLPMSHNGEELPCFLYERV